MNRALNFASKYAYALGSSAYLFTFGLLSPRHRPLITQLSRHFGHSGLLGISLDLPEVPLGALAPDTLPVELREPEGVDGNVSLYELLALSRLVRHHRPATLFEIGTFDGRTTLNLAANGGADARVVTLDLPRAEMETTELAVESRERQYIAKTRSGARFRGSDCEPRITQLYGDSATVDLAAYEGTMDFVFVDGSHAHEYVLNDSRRALELLRDGRGVILWHDYGEWAGVTQALNELRAAGGPFAGLRRIAGTTLAYLHLA